MDDSTQNLSVFMADNFSEPTFKYSLQKKDKHGKVLNWEFEIKKIEADRYAKVSQYFAILSRSLVTSAQICQISTSKLDNKLDKKEKQEEEQQNDIVNTTNPKDITCPTKEMLDLLEKLHPDVLELLAASILTPNLKNAKLQDSYKRTDEFYPPSGAKLLERMLNTTELFSLLSEWLNQSLENSPVGLIEKIKN